MHKKYNPSFYNLRRFIFKYGGIQNTNVIDVDCRDVKPMMRDMLVYVSDQIAAIPTIKSHGFALEPLEQDGIDAEAVVTSVREYIDSVGEGKKYAIVAQNNTVTVRSVSGEPMKGTGEKKHQDDALFTCSHCGYVTRFETDLKAHMVIHYL